MARIEKLRTMLEKNPDDPFLHFGVAMELCKSGEHDAGIESFDRAIALDEAYLAAYHHKASALIAMNCPDDARATLAAGIKAAAKAGDAHARSEMEELLAAIPS